MKDNYMSAIWQHSKECLEDLDSLAEKAQQRHFNRLEMRAAERALQVLIESCIGVAKYWLKVEHKNLPVDAYDSFTKLAELQKISTEELKQWRKVIGMRNALVHDYLTIDTELVQMVLTEQSYHFLHQFIRRAKDILENES